MACNIRSGNGDRVGCLALTGHSRDFTEDWIRSTGDKLTSLARLLPMQVPSLSMMAAFCGR
ncbi:MAG: hypothetical protein ACK5IP_06200 [Paracoccus sp. (in: a-proteobacteria)]